MASRRDILKAFAAIPFAGMLRKPKPRSVRVDGVVLTERDRVLVTNCTYGSGGGGRAMSVGSGGDGHCRIYEF